MRMRVVGLAMVLALTATACGADGGSEPAPTVTVTVTEQAEAAEMDDVSDESETVADTADAPAEGGQTVAFGETVTLPDKEGTITISKPTAFKPSENIVEFIQGDWDEYVVMDVTERNDGAEPVPAGWSIQATTGSAEAAAFVDTDKGVDTPTVNVMPGKSIKYKVAFGRKKGEDFVLQASPVAGLNSVYFQ